MNENIKKMWVDALRSGDYRQTIGNLYEFHDDRFPPCDRGDFHCALGVLADLYEKDTGKMNAYGSHLDDTCLAWAGLKGNPTVQVTYDEYEGSRAVSVDELNDEWGWDFRRIANYIEAQL